MTCESDGLRLERLARMAEADNWLHGFVPRRRRWCHAPASLVIIGGVLAACFVLFGL